MATIKDVAKTAGVSISTVSYALNDDSRIPEKTAKKIKDIAADIGYYPSAAARNLQKRTTGTILVAISDFGGPVYHAL
ncbi:MAG: LacI family DNA-binding transcriptional regulator, partial [bacterium]